MFIIGLSRVILGRGNRFVVQSRLPLKAAEHTFRAGDDGDLFENLVTHRDLLALNRDAVFEVLLWTREDLCQEVGLVVVKLDEVGLLRLLLLFKRHFAEPEDCVAVASVLVALEVEYRPQADKCVRIPVDEVAKSVFALGIVGLYLGTYRMGRL